MQTKPKVIIIEASTSAKVFLMNDEEFKRTIVRIMNEKGNEARRVKRKQKNIAKIK